MIVSSSSRHSAKRNGPAPAYAALAGLLVAGGVLAGALAGCGAPAEGDTATAEISPFNSGNGGSSANGSGTAANGPAPALCIAGKARCDGGRTLETCNGAGTAFEATQCSSGSVCYSGQCQPLNCKAGESVCLGEEIHTCNADGKSATLLRTCNSGSACSPATHDCAPLLCEPLLAACSGNTATRCDATGFAFDLSTSTSCTGGLSCSAGACGGSESSTPPGLITQTPPGQLNPTPVPAEVQQVAQACTANQVWCDGNRLNTCNAQGTAFTAQDCGTGACGGAGTTPACLPAQVCTPGATSCDGANTIGTCAADGNAVAITRCPNGTNCTGSGQCTPVQCNPSGMLSHNGNGGVTVYWFAQGTLAVPPRDGQDVNCSFNATRANNDDGGQNDRVAYAQDPALFGAMNFAEYAGAAACGACVQLTQGGRNVTITVADSCNPAINNNGTCTNGHIDLSRSAFQQLTGQSTGDINGISWRYVPCDNVGEVQFLLKKADDQYWNQFLVLNHRYPIVKAEVLMQDGRWVAARREAYNYWLPAEGAGPGGDMGTYRVRVTDINGGIVEEQLELRAGLQGGNAQFECQ